MPTSTVYVSINVQGLDETGTILSDCPSSAKATSECSYRNQVNGGSLWFSTQHSLTHTLHSNLYILCSWQLWFYWTQTMATATTPCLSWLQTMAIATTPCLNWLQPATAPYLNLLQIMATATTPCPNWFKCTLTDYWPMPGYLHCLRISFRYMSATSDKTCQ